MASTSKNLSSTLPSPADEGQWVLQIRALIEEEIEEDDMKTPSSIFCVPQPMVSFCPHAYIPQLFAFGPYHHWQPQLYDMERYKLAAARRVQERLRGGGRGFEDVVAGFEKRELKIRCHYHKYLDLSAKTLAWMMAIDASFLLNFLQNNYSDHKPEFLQDSPAKTLSKMMAKEKMKLGFNMLRRDTLMLENQIPFFLLKNLNYLLYPSKQSGREQLSKLLVGFVKDASPFKTLTVQNCNNLSYAHLLDLLYRSIVPEFKQLPPLRDPAQENIHTGANLIAHSQPRIVWNGLWKFVSEISPRPVKLVFKLPWKLITSLLPIGSKLESILTNNTDRPSTVEEIAMPSVSEISSVGVHFKSTDGDMSTIRFDRKTLTIFLPAVIIDETTDVLLRNLVAYEATAVTGPMVFTRYVELMHGMIDTAEDVKILRAVGVVENRMKSEEEAAEMWNGMSRSVRMRRVGFLDKMIGDVNKYYRSVWRVKAGALMRKYVLESWQVLTFFGAGLLLVLACVQTFCSVYSCSAHLAKITNMGGD